MGKNNKVLKFRKRSREEADKAANIECDDDDDGEEMETAEGIDSELKERGSYVLAGLKETEEYKSRIELNGPKRKYAVCFGYLGSAYQGLQINPGCRSVEAELERALFLAGGFHECNYGYLQKLQWSRAARTDRGVHAVGQCCAMKLTIPVAGKDEFIQQVNKLLPADIQVHTLTKVTKNFNSKLTCSQRRYHYLLPTYLLKDAGSVVDLLNVASTKQGPIRDCARQGGYAEPGASVFLGNKYCSEVRLCVRNYRATLEEIERLRVGLQQFVGTNSFHNYTTGKTSQDASARRYIKSFDCGEPFVDAVHGVEWVLLSVVGQSFLLNQIRKMVAMATEHARGQATLQSFTDSFSDMKMDIPLVPGLGLYLDELYFDQYNVKQQLEKEKKEQVAKSSKRRATSGNAGFSVDQIKAAAVAAVNNALASANAPAVGVVVEESAAKDPADEVKEVPAPVPVPADADEGGEVVLGEPILWSKEPATLAAMQRFRDAVIWPHIFEEEEKNLHFMYYLDFLRVRKFTYESKVKK